MLLTTYDPQGAQNVSSKEILNHISASCRAQNIADQQLFVHWSRHLLSNILQITGCELLIGTSAVTHSPKFPHFSSPYPPDVHLGAVAEWPQVPALLVMTPSILK